MRQRDFQEFLGSTSETQTSGMQHFGTILRGSSLWLQVAEVSNGVKLSSFWRAGDGEKFNRPRSLSISFQLVLENIIQRLQIRSPHNHSVDSWAKVTLEICDSRGRSCFIHSTEVKYKGKGERTDLCGKCHLGCNLSLSELCLSEGLVTLWKSLLSGCYYCSQFPTKISLLSSLAMQLLAEKKQNLCVAARAAKLKVRVQRQIAASPGLGLELTRGTSHAPTKESARDLCRQIPGKKPKRKHPSKMQMGENRVSSSPLGICRWNCWSFLSFWDMAESAIPCVQKEQGKVNLKKLGNTSNFCVYPTVQMFSPCQILPFTKQNKTTKEKILLKKKEEGKKTGSPRHHFAECNLYTEGYYVVVPLLIQPFWGKKIKPKNPLPHESKDTTTQSTGVGKNTSCKPLSLIRSLLTWVRLYICLKFYAKLYFNNTPSQ